MIDVEAPAGVVDAHLPPGRQRRLWRGHRSDRGLLDGCLLRVVDGTAARRDALLGRLLVLLLDLLLLLRRPGERLLLLVCRRRRYRAGEWLLLRLLLLWLLGREAGGRRKLRVLRCERVGPAERARHARRQAGRRRLRLDGRPDVVCNEPEVELAVDDEAVRALLELAREVPLAVGAALVAHAVLEQAEAGLAALRQLLFVEQLDADDG